MSNAKLTYVGPLQGRAAKSPASVPFWQRVPLAFLLVVVLPTLVTAAYYLLIATPRYVSEAQFIVRTAEQRQPSSLGVALQGVGLSQGQTDAFAVHRYIRSRDGLRALSQRIDVAAVLNANADPLSRFPRPWEGRTFEDLYQSFLRFVDVGYDSTTGISTIRVEAFSARDAQAMNNALLNRGELLVNQLNERAQADAVAESAQSVREADERLRAAQTELSNFRNREGIIDPARTATEGASMIGELLTTLATIQAERAQLAAQAPQSPQLAILDSRIAAFRRQIDIERGRLAGDNDSLARKIGAYEALVLDRESANRALVTATLSLDEAQQDARRKQLYLERVVSPNLPDKAVEPKRLISILTVLISTLLAYGIGWLIWAGVREHRQM